MFNKTFKKQATILGAASVALAMSASSHAVFTALDNGGFDNGDHWGFFADGGGGSTATIEASGGNPGGYGLSSDAAGGWGAGFVYNDSGALSLGDMGLTAGQTYTFSFDMKDDNGHSGAALPAEQTGIKFETFGGATPQNTGNIQFNALDTGWNTYTQNFTIDADATFMKIVLFATDGAGVVGFDNLGIEVAAVPVPAAAWLFGSALAGLVAVRRRK